MSITLVSPVAGDESATRFESPNAGLTGAVALLLDYPLLLRATRALDPENIPLLADIVRRAASFGPLLVARAYGAWYDADEATTAFSAGIEPVFVPTAGPGLVPSATAIVADGLRLLHDRTIDTLVLSGDDRLLPLAAAAHARGVQVRLLAHSCADQGPCVRLATTVEPVHQYVRTLTRAEKYRRVPPPGRRTA